MVIVVLIFSFASLSHASSARIQPTSTPAVFTSDEGDTKGMQQSVPGGDETPPTSRLGNVQPQSIAATSTGALVYFAPQDNDANATVLLLYNTGAVTRTVTITGYNETGAFAGSWILNIGPKRLVHAVSDSVAASPPPSWANAVVVNFTDFTFIAGMAVPQDVKVDGYVIFNPGTGTVDPRADQGGIPLRFSADPLSLFLPVASNAP
jgi:hypothetical protein